VVDSCANPQDGRREGEGMEFDLIDIHLFANIAKTNSLTRGAELSHLCPSAASKRIKNVEEKIGTCLFFRSAAGVRLTPAGQALHNHSRLLLHELENLERDLRHCSEGPNPKELKGTIRISAGSIVVSEFLPAVLKKYSAMYPNVNVEVRAQLSPEILRAVNSSEADIGIYLGSLSAGKAHPRLCGRCRMVLITSRSHPLALQKLKEISFAETLDFDYITLPENSASHAFLKQASEMAGKRLKVRFQLPTFDDLRRMVKANLGIAVVPDFITHHMQNAKDIYVVRLNDDWAVCDLWICMRRGVPSRMVKDFAELLIASGMTHKDKPVIGVYDGNDSVPRYKTVNVNHA
jgi:DNA-binding transcriptional LysR family regulator